MTPPSSTIEAPSAEAAEEAAATLAGAEAPPRPEGAADDGDGFYDSEADAAEPAESIDPAKLRESAGITRDEEEARTDAAGQAQINGLENAAVTDYDRKVWAEIIGGNQPDKVQISVKGLPSLTIENVNVADLKKGKILELRVRAQVTGYGATDKLKHNLESEELEISGTTEKRGLTIVAAAVVDDD